MIPFPKSGPQECALEGDVGTPGYGDRHTFS